MPASEQTRGNGGEERGGNPKNLAAVSSSPHLERVDGNTLLPQGGGEQTGLLVQNAQLSVQEELLVQGRAGGKSAQKVAHGKAGATTLLPSSQCWGGTT